MLSHRADPCQIYRRLDARDKRRRSYGVVAPETDAKNTDTIMVDIISRLDPVHHRLGGMLVRWLNMQQFLGLALPWPVNRQRRQPAPYEVVGGRLDFLFGRVKPREHDDHRRPRYSCR